MKHILIFTLLNIVSFSSLADIKFFPASMCEAESPTDQLALNRAEGRLKNIGSTDVIVRCPLVKDDTTEGKINRLYVWATYASNGSCQAQTIDPATNLVKGSVVPMYAGSTIAPSIAYNLNSKHSQSSYSLSCILTPNSTLHFYKFTE